MRFIPTPVGNGPFHGPPSPSRAVHPHACGERLNINGNHLDTPGSSPRLWGTVTTKSLYVLLVRFIPTPVGNGSERFLKL